MPASVSRKSFKRETLYRAKKAMARPPIRVTNEPAPRDLASLVVTVDAVPEAAEPDLVAVWVAVTTVLEPLGLVVVTVPLLAAEVWVVRVVGAAELEDDEVEVVLTDEDDEVEVVLVCAVLAGAELAAEEPVAEPLAEAEPELDEAPPPEMVKGKEYSRMLGSESKVISMPYLASAPRDEDTAQANSPAELATPALMTEIVCSVLEVAPPSRVRVIVSLLYSVEGAQVMV